MECAPCERRNRGRWGEALVDSFMDELGWSCLLKNVIVPRGEIDRVYTERRPLPSRGPMTRLPGAGQAPRRFCLAEVKVTSVEGPEDLAETLSEVGLRRFLRAHQLRNLARLGEGLLRNDGRGGARPEVHVRLFLAIRFRLRNGAGLPPELLCPAKVCVARPDVLLLSFLPEYCSESAMGVQVRWR